MNSESEVSDDFRKKLHCTMAFIGGYIGAYALLNRADVFGNAQTSNLIHVAMSIVGTDFFRPLYKAWRCVSIYGRCDTCCYMAKDYKDKRSLPCCRSRCTCIYNAWIFS